MKMHTPVRPYAIHIPRDPEEKATVGIPKTPNLVYMRSVMA